MKTARVVNSQIEAAALAFQGWNMKFGMQHPNFTYDGQGSRVADSLKELATEAERIGFDSFWVMDHFHQIQYVGQPNEPMLECWTTISALAGMTSKIKLGPLVGERLQASLSSGQDRGDARRS